MNKRISILIVTIFLSLTSSGQTTFQDKLKLFLESKGMEGASSGISVIESGTGKTIAGLNENTALIPASVLKTVTSATALEVLGPDYRFKTVLGYNGERDTETNILRGNLIVVGGGDPTLGSEYFPSEITNSDFLDGWISQIGSSGIKKVEGNIVVDSGIFKDDDIPGTWVWDDLGNYYGAGAYGITVYDNLFRIVFRSGSAGTLAEVIRTIPEVPELEIVNEVRASKTNRDNAYVFGSPWGGKRIVKGTIPENKEEFTIRAALPEPAKFLGELLKNRLTGKGIEVSGRVLVQKADTTGFHTLLVHQSPALSDIIKILNYESVNLFAEQLLKHLSLSGRGTGSVSDGTGFIGQYWKSKGLSTDGLFIEDGSGLSHYNAITASQLTWILNYMKTQIPAYQSFYESLPTAGKGTLAVFSPADFPGNSLKAKSGSLTRVRNYVGYLKADSGKELVFAFLFNNFSLSSTQMINEIKNLMLILKKEY